MTKPDPSAKAEPLRFDYGRMLACGLWLRTCC